MPQEIPKAYEPQEIEERWAKAWYEENLFRAENSGNPRVAGTAQPRFSIALPPPNVTGSIHIGHMLEHTQIDMLVRWHRMRGERTLWLSRRCCGRCSMRRSSGHRRCIAPR